MGGKYRGDPHDAQKAGSDKGVHHRDEGEPHAALTSHHDLHRPAEEIGHGEEEQARLPESDGLRVVRKVDAEQRFGKRITEQSEGESDHRHEAEAAEHHAVDLLRLPRPDVLPDEGQGGVVDRVLGDVGEALDAGGGSVPRHDDVYQRSR